MDKRELKGEMWQKLVPQSIKTDYKYANNIFFWWKKNYANNMGPIERKKKKSLDPMKEVGDIKKFQLLQLYRLTLFIS